MEFPNFREVFVGGPVFFQRVGGEKEETFEILAAPLAHIKARRLGNCLVSQTYLGVNLEWHWRLRVAVPQKKF